MKKLFTFLLAAGMFSMYACSSSTTETNSTSTDTTMMQSAPAEPMTAPADSGATMPDSQAH